MQKKETAIEIKVGALVLFSVALLVAFVLVLGDFSFSKGFTFKVQFDNAGGLKPGADVAIAGINVGHVTKLQFVHNATVPGHAKTSAVAVRATLRVQKHYADAVREDSLFYITTRGVLGEPYIEIVTDDLGSPPVKPGDVLQGVNPPRMEIIISKMSKLLTIITKMFSNPRIHAADLLANTSSLMKHLDQIVVTNRKNIDGTFDGVRLSATEAAKLLAALNNAVQDGSSLRATLGDAHQTLANTRAITQKVNGSLTPLLGDITATAKSARSLTASADDLITGKKQEIADSIDQVHKSTQNVAQATGDVRTMVANVKAGKGTIGALLKDHEMYDDMKELLRTIKRRPWKIIWKE